jgi:hypothetical protein
MTTQLRGCDAGPGPARPSGSAVTGARAWFGFRSERHRGHAVDPVTHRAVRPDDGVAAVTAPPSQRGGHNGSGRAAEPSVHPTYGGPNPYSYPYHSGFGWRSGTPDCEGVAATHQRTRAHRPGPHMRDPLRSSTKVLGKYRVYMYSAAAFVCGQCNQGSEDRWGAQDEQVW